jgi:hypothetical protein
MFSPPVPLEDARSFCQEFRCRLVWSFNAVNLSIFAPSKGVPMKMTALRQKELHTFTIFYLRLVTVMNVLEENDSARLLVAYNKAWRTRNKVRWNKESACWGTPFPCREGGGGLGRPVRCGDTCNAL